MGETDSELWLRASNGSSEAFGVLFERHARAIYNYCFRRTADWALAEDLMSTVFLEAWRRRDVVPENVLAWLYGIATNVVRNQRRSLRRNRAALARVPAPRPDEDFADERNARMDDERRMHAVLRSVQALPRREQDVLALCAWSGLSYDEAAMALQLPIGTVRSRLSRARARLRELESDSGHEKDSYATR